MVKNAIFFSLNILFFFMAGLLVATYVSFEKQIPDLEQLEYIEHNEITRFYSADSVLLKEFYSERRELAYYNEIPQELKNAVIAIEDQRFYRHWGIDLKRIVKALIVDIISLKKAQGASTITQQLSRSLFLSQEKKVSRKIKEIITAIKLERMYSKEQILTMYLNTIYFGPSIYGIKSASQYYFKKLPQELNLAECAFLAGIIQSPGNYHPNRYAEKAKFRRKLVLLNMLKLNMINQSQYQAAHHVPIEKIQSVKKEKIGSYFIEYARKYILKNYGYDYLYKGGLSVYLNMNYETQKISEQAMIDQLNEKQKDLTKGYDLDSLDTEGLKNLPDSIQQKLLQAAVFVMNAQNGKVECMIGGRDYDYNEFNRAVQSPRQPGSSFKPFLYTAALDNGFTPASMILDQPIAVQVKADEVWIPNNIDKKIGGFITLRNALKKSKNLISIRLIGKIKPNTVIYYARQMGIHSHLNPYTSLALGTSEVHLNEITAAYTVFANNGFYIEPVYIEKIVDNQGNILEDNSYKINKKLVIRPEVAYLMTDMLKTVINHGTGIRTRILGFDYPDAAGKTGTTNDYTDAWFIGFTPYYICGVWVGIDNNTSMGRHGTGARMALPIWTEIMKYLHQEKEHIEFVKPNKIIQRKICSESHQLATPNCHKSYNEYFIQGNLPKPCHLHSRFNRKKSNNLNDFDIDDF